MLEFPVFEWRFLHHSRKISERDTTLNFILEIFGFLAWVKSISLMMCDINITGNPEKFILSMRNRM